ncbi:bifunctional phosphopantothenoylcysteine decarboxylase/phosphopantothenate--cysteine ligase CoaBC [Scrofimicrobium sp. R131]|uniref:Coenzyme A biosynthesis bifunctional protein CoaBC n=1 Tax=Scrofimicrobium appendicitidis TaxID=3079930 RepID=A0AAU7V666_9ACTO
MLPPASSSGGAPTVLLGVGGGIAAFKLVTVVRRLRQVGVDVYVLPTEASLEFVGEQTWQELSEHPIGVKVLHGPGELSHIELARRADLFLVAPATADLLAQLRLGLASNLLTATFLAADCPKLLSPAMHTNMWENPATQDNVATLRARGVEIIEPATGALSSGDTGAGRLPEPDAIVEEVLARLAPGALAGRRVVVTAGGTIEPIDPVRYLGNHSSGRQGIELALVAARRGAEVDLLLAQTQVPPPQHPRIRLVHTPTALEMRDALARLVPGAHALFMAAAVADYRPRAAAEQKLKKGTWAETIELVENPDLLREVAEAPWRPEVLVGFGAETGSEEQVLARGMEKARRKGADLLAINRVGDGHGFGEVENRLLVVDRTGQPVADLVGDKSVLAAQLVELAMGVSR